MRGRHVPYALLLASLLGAASAQANDTRPERAESTLTGIWPGDCTRDIQRDGLVLVDGALGAFSVSLRPSRESSDLSGAFQANAGDAQAWKSSEPLLPRTEYRLEVQPLDETGAPVGPAQLSHFTTGDDLQVPLAFAGLPAARVLPHTAAASDNSEFSVESLREGVVVLRIALPGLVGGLSRRALQLEAALLDDTSSEQALNARVRDSQSATPNQPVAFQLQAVLADEPSQRCVAITASQDSAALTAPEFCIELPARIAPEAPENDVEAPYELGEGSQAREVSGQGSELSLESAAAQASAGGCSLGSGNPGRDVSWFLLAMLPFLASRRRQQTRAR